MNSHGMASTKDKIGEDAKCQIANTIQNAQINITVMVKVGKNLPSYLFHMISR